jgi:DNA-binding winged helix-turn-helix (wHTH) protein/tetratricopeptide (TPR) repeat protein
MNPDSEEQIYRFGPFCLDAKQHLLLRDGHVVPLPAKALTTLHILVTKQGQLVEKDLLMRKVWPDEFVEESNLAQHIFMLRRALGETTGGQKYIETIPRRGYRFVTTVSEPEYQEFESKSNGTSKPPPEVTSIAVLPFETIGIRSQDEYLGLGLADALITRLTRIRRLTVRPTSAVRNAAKLDPVAVGENLRVAAVLEGTIQKADDYVRVTIQLVRSHDGATLWAEKFDEKLTSIFLVEDSISEQVATALALKLSTDEQSELAKRHTENNQAYQAYLRGRYFFEKRTQEGFQKSLEYFESAIRLDPNFALAYAGLSHTYATLAAFDVLPSAEAISKSREAALKALAIEANLAEAHAALGRSKLFDWDWEGAEKHLKLAIELNPNDSASRHFYANYLRHMRRFAEALAESRRAEALDPTSAVRKAAIGATLYLSKRYAEALEELNQARDLDPRNLVPNYYLARVYLQQSRFSEAEQQYQDTIAFYGRTPELVAHLGHLYAVSGRKNEAENMLSELENATNRGHNSSFFKALVFTGLGEKDHAFDWLEKAFQEHDPNLVTLTTDPLVDSLREDSRYTDLLDRVGLLAHLDKS